MTRALERPPAARAAAGLHVGVVLAVALAGTAHRLAAQTDPPAGDVASAADSLAALYPPHERAAPVPFGPGERMEYRVEILWFDVGEGSLSIEAVDTVRGHDVYRAVMEIDGSMAGLKVHDVYTSFFDVETLQSWRFLRDMRQVNYRGTRYYEMLPEKGIWDRPDKDPDAEDRSGPLGSSLPLDDISFIYFLRQMELEVGRTYTLPRYFKEDGNPVVLKVVRRERRKVDAGEFDCLVIRPVIQTDGMFSEGGEAELYVSDDDRRLLVYLKSNVPRFPGALELYLKDYTPGVPLNPRLRNADER